MVIATGMIDSVARREAGRYLGFGELLVFRPNGRGRQFLGVGWSGPEQAHCWSDGTRATLELRFAAQPQRDVDLHVLCAGYVPASETEAQQVILSVAGEEIGQWNVRGKAWHTVTIGQSLFKGCRLQLDLSIPRANSPSLHGASPDARLLGIDIDSMVLLPRPDLDAGAGNKIAAGHDPVGDMFVESGSFHRAIRRESAPFFEDLLQRNVYSRLADANLIPRHFVREIDHPRYRYVASAVSGRFIFPPKYPWLMLRDAALAWVAINLKLLDLSGKAELGLCDGHYGNFIQCEGGTPKWCDIGSITDVESGLRFGYGEFIRCYMYPLLLSTRDDLRGVNLRQSMALNPQGLDPASMMPDRDLEGDFDIPLDYETGGRRAALDVLEKRLRSMDVREQKGYWSSYRNAAALDAAWEGELLQPGQDTRFAAIMEQVRRCAATSFVDIGCNDGVFSLLCVRDGMHGIGMDIDEDSLNKLYGFISQRRDVGLGISYGDFMVVEHKADLVLALALTHHLVLSQGLSFEQIAAKLADVAARHVITEFMPDGLGGTPLHPRPSPDPLPETYSLEAYVASLRKHFARVEVVDYERRADPAHLSRRTLITCSKTAD